jgi:prepilin-type N-terminal cleavage/methylation domain-containing protein
MKGLTIVEVLVAIVVFSIVALALGYAVVVGKSALLSSDIPTQLRQNVIFSIMSMAHELRQTAPAKTNITEGTSSSAITFKIPYDSDSDGDVVDKIGNVEWGQDITYALDGSGQLRRTYAGTTSVIAPNISSLEFSRPAGQDEILQIDIIVQKKDGQGKVYQDAEQAIIKMRN